MNPKRIFIALLLSAGLVSCSLSGNKFNGEEIPLPEIVMNGDAGPYPDSNSFNDGNNKLFASMRPGNGEAIVIERHLLGCFASEKETVVVYNNNHHYLVMLTKSNNGLNPITVKKKFGSFFGREIDRFYIEYSKLIAENSKDPEYYTTSTTSVNIRVRKGGREILLPITELPDLKPYKDLLKLIDPGPEGQLPLKSSL